MDVNQLYGLAGIPVIAALIQVFKNTLPECPDRFWPLISLALGITFNMLLGWGLGAELWVAAVIGLVVGLSASGFYSQSKTLTSG